MFGSANKSKIADLAYELDRADEELERAKAQIERLYKEAESNLHKMNVVRNELAAANVKVAKLEERMAAMVRDNKDLQTSLAEAVRKENVAKQHEQAALTDWSRLTVWILDHAPEDIIHGSTGSTVDLAIALLTRWMPTEEQNVVDADIVDDASDEKNDDSVTVPSRKKIDVKYVDPIKKS